MPGLFREWVRRNIRFQNKFARCRSRCNRSGQHGFIGLHLLIEYRHQPVLQGMLAQETGPLIMGQHLLPPGPDSFGHIGSLQQTAIKGRHKLLRPADIEAVAHCHHAADTGLEQSRRHRGECVLGLLVNPGGLAGVEHHDRNAVFGQQLAEFYRLHRSSLSLVIFKEQPALRSAFKSVRGNAVLCWAVTAVSVKMNNMIEARFLPKLLAELVKAGRAEYVNMHGQLLVTGQFHQRTGQGMKTDILVSTRSGNDQQDVDAVFGQIFRQGQRVWHIPADLPLNPAMMGQGAAFRIIQGLPGPSQNLGIIGRNFQVQVFQALFAGLLQPEIGLLVKQRLKAVLAPLPQSILDPLGHIRKGPCGQFKKLLQIPAQILLESAAWTTGNSGLSWPGQRHRSRGLQVAAAQNHELRFVLFVVLIILITDMLDLELKRWRRHDHLVRVYLRVRGQSTPADEGDDLPVSNEPLLRRRE